jgi:hypothetical protein
MRTEAERAWAAGVFAAVGTVTVHRHPSSTKGRRDTGGGRVQLAFTDRRVAHRFHEIVSCGMLRGPRARGRRAWEWIAETPHDVAALHRVLRRHLSARGADLDLVTALLGCPSAIEEVARRRGNAGLDG